MNWLQNLAISHFLPYFLPPLVFAIVQLAKKLIPMVDGLPPWVKQGVVYALAQVFVFAQSWVGQTLPCADHCTLADLANAPDFIKGILVAVSAFLLHWLKNRPIQQA